MSSLILLCRLCLSYTNDCMTISKCGQNQLEDIICRHLSLKIDDEDPCYKNVCRSCVDRVIGFDKFYKIVAENQKCLRNIFRDETSDKIMHSTAMAKSDDCSKDVLLPNPNINASEMVTPPDEHDIRSCSSIETEDENDNDNMDAEYPTNSLNDSDLKHKISGSEQFPTELVRDDKLIFRGQELIALIQKFYTLSCDQCPKEERTTECFISLDEMIKHYAEKHNMKGYVICCDMKLIKLSAMALHMARHLQPDAFKCKICDKMLTCPKILQNHVQNHLPEEKRPLACPECPRRFSYSSALVAHVIIHQPESERASHVCTECNKTFVSAGRLTTHMNVAHMDHGQQFICPKCSKRFACRSNLNYHMTTHQQNVRQVQCERCGKWLKNKLCLKKHMVQHSSIRYDCTLCSYSALNQQCLRNHIKVKHSSEKPHKCSHCDKSFKLKKTLISHMVQHSGIKRYICEFCQRAFASSGNFYAHRKRMHPQQLAELLEKREREENRLRATQQATKQEALKQSVDC